MRWITGICNLFDRFVVFDFDPLRPKARYGALARLILAFILVASIGSCLQVSHDDARDVWTMLGHPVAEWVELGIFVVVLLSSFWIVDQIVGRIENVIGNMYPSPHTEATEGSSAEVPSNPSKQMDAYRFLATQGQRAVIYSTELHDLKADLPRLKEEHQRYCDLLDARKSFVAESKREVLLPLLATATNLFQADPGQARHLLDRLKETMLARCIPSCSEFISFAEKVGDVVEAAEARQLLLEKPWLDSVDEFEIHRFLLRQETEALAFFVLDLDEDAEMAAYLRDTAGWVSTADEALLHRILPFAKRLGADRFVPYETAYHLMTAYEMRGIPSREELADFANELNFEELKSLLADEA